MITILLSVLLSVYLSAGASILIITYTFRSKDVNTLINLSPRGIMVALTFLVGWPFLLRMAHTESQLDSGQ